MSRQKHIIYRLLAAGLMLAAVFLLTACSTSAGSVTSPAAASGTPDGRNPGQALTLYRTPTLFVPPSPTAAATLTPLPSPTPAPRSHIVKKGEDLGGIAYLYHVTVADIMAANPKVDPHAMSVGTELVIPASKTPQAQPQITGTGIPNASPTPIPVTTGALVCSRSLDGGIWCFLPVHNTQGFALEGLSARIRISDAAVSDPTVRKTIEQTAYLPLDVLPDGAALALAAHFSPEQAAAISGPLQAGSELLSALPNPEDGRYLPARVEQTQVKIAPDSLTAEIETEVRLEQEDASAGRVWVAATAYDQQGNVVGIRRWENDNAHPLKSGQALKVVFSIYSVSGKIDRVELLPEACP